MEQYPGEGFFVDKKPLSALELPKRKSSHFIFKGLWDSSAAQVLT
jgi:hypothetical protein